MNKLSLVKTFGGAVTYLSDEYEDFNTSSHRKEILKRINDDPSDVVFRTAWETFSKGTHKHYKGSRLPRKPRIVYIWQAIDVETGENYEAISAFKLARKLGVTESVIVNNRRDNRMVNSRYKIIRKKAQ
ncbi:hypothetical protein [Ligilactobacillus animalis]|uniref:hypothetical protein n=1 Tax=Ligilactobacillus animalis TaxID=1605 RepID=UPI00384E46F5